MQQQSVTSAKTTEWPPFGLVNELLLKVDSKKKIKRPFKHGPMKGKVRQTKSTTNAYFCATTKCRYHLGLHLCCLERDLLWVPYINVANSHLYKRFTRCCVGGRLKATPAIQPSPNHRVFSPSLSNKWHCSISWLVQLPPWSYEISIAEFCKYPQVFCARPGGTISPKCL